MTSRVTSQEGMKERNWTCTTKTKRIQSTAHGVARCRRNLALLQQDSHERKLTDHEIY
jgi:hypothetical protein